MEEVEAVDAVDELAETDPKVVVERQARYCRQVAEHEPAARGPAAEPVEEVEVEAVDVGQPARPLHLELVEIPGEPLPAEKEAVVECDGGLAGRPVEEEVEVEVEETERRRQREVKAGERELGDREARAAARDVVADRDRRVAEEPREVDRGHLPDQVAEGEQVAQREAGQRERRVPERQALEPGREQAEHRRDVGG